jgi:hypothetical protein
VSYTISVDKKKEGSKKGQVESQQRTATKKETEKSSYTCIVKRSILNLNSVSTPNMSFLATADVSGSSTDAEDVGILPRFFPSHHDVVVVVGGDGD